MRFARVRILSGGNWLLEIKRDVEYLSMELEKSREKLTLVDDARRY